MLLHYFGKLKNHLHGHMPENIIDTATDHWRKHLQACVHFNPFCEQINANNLHFHVFLVQVASAHGVRFLLCWHLMVDRPTLVNCKALSWLRTVNEQNVKCWYFHSLNLCMYCHDIWQTSVGQMTKSKVTFATCFTCTKSAKFLIFKFPKVMQQHT